MKQVLFFSIVGFFTACSGNNEAKVKSATNTDSTVSAMKAEPAYPYSPTYTSKFEIGDPAHSKTILDLQKAWDDNQLDNARSLFADSVTMLTAGGNVMNTTADSVIASSKPYRSSLGTVHSTVHAWVPLKSTDKNENWVLLWYTEYHQRGNGKTDSTEYQETWRVNNKGKADLMMQYERKFPPAEK